MLDAYQTQARSLSFQEKLQYLLGLIEEQEITEIEAYRILTADGEPKLPEEPERSYATIDYF